MELSAVFASYVNQGRVTASPDDPDSIVRGLSPHFWKAALRLRLPSGWERADVLHIGLMAALECVKRYDPERGGFHKFAFVTGRNAMLKAVMEADACVRIPYEACRTSTEAARVATYADRGRVELDATTPDGTPLSAFIGFSDSIENQIDLKRTLEKMSPTSRQAFLDSAMEIPSADGANKGALNARRQRALTKLNATPVEKPNPKKSGVVGAHFQKATGKWQAHLYRNSGKVYVGLFATVDEAARALESARLVA